MSDTTPHFRPIDRSEHELLVVDDNPVSRYTTGRVLRAAGFRIREAATGAEGLEAADGSISALVLDVHLPDLDGFEVCRILRSRPESARTPVLHLTASRLSDEDKVRGLDAGADAYLTHPVEPAVLVATVHALVRARVAEEAMRSSERKFRAIYSRAPGGICLLDEDGRFVDANPAMLALLRRTADAVVGHTIGEFAASPFAKELARSSRPVELLSATPELPLVDPEGNLIHLAWAISSDVEPGVSIAQVSDISQRLQLERQRLSLLESERDARSTAESMNRMKDDLIAVLSHELRTPLNAIIGWTHVLQLRGGNEEVTRGLSAIERNARIQARMISDILDMSRLNTGKMPLTIAEVDPSEVVATAVSSMQGAFEEGQLRVTTVLPIHGRHIAADGARLQQVVWNLLSNAIKFSPPGGEVRVVLRDVEDGVVLTVSDQGTGIDPAFLPYLFDRFTQSDVGSTRQRGGLGLGLAIVKHLVEAHGGSVSAESEGLGKGTTFEVQLPASGVAQSSEEPESTMASGEHAAIARGERLLEGLNLVVVDDDPDACAMLQIILRDRGAQVRAALTYEGALALLQQAPPDLLVSDIGMPGKDGYDLIRAVREGEAGTERHLPAIALTSFAREKDQQQAIASGFDAHCAKPVRPMQLIQQIVRLVAQHANDGEDGASVAS